MILSFFSVFAAHLEKPGKIAALTYSLDITFNDVWQDVEEGMKWKWSALLQEDILAIIAYFFI